MNVLAGGLRSVYGNADMFDTAATFMSKFTRYIEEPWTKRHLTRPLEKSALKEFKDTYTHILHNWKK